MAAVIAKPVPGRNANTTVSDVGGSLIDLTVLDQQSDQLSCFYPETGRYAWRFQRARCAAGTEKTDGEAAISLQGTFVELVCESEPDEDGLSVALTYRLNDGEPSLLVTSTFKNSSDQSLKIDLGDRIRADRLFEFGSHPDLAWCYDKWFGQAYGVSVEDHGFELETDSGRRGTQLRYLKNDKSRIVLAAGEQYSLARRIYPGTNLIQVRAIANELAGITNRRLTVQVVDAAGPVPDADIMISQDEPYAWGRTSNEGTLVGDLPAGEYKVTVESGPRGSKTAVAATDAVVRIELPQPGYVAGQITDFNGGPIPCKVQFRGVEGTPDPDFGPDSGEHAVKNLVYTVNGLFHHEIGPGTYDVIISRGPEYDAVYRQIEVKRGQATQLAARLVRTVSTPGWISTDFHSHSSPSGDNTSSQYGRVLNLVCEHLEFAPCTEHNRISSYLPHLERLDATHLMATCAGIELTGSLLPVNHQNAFPLIHKPRTQDGGAPRTHDDPAVQIERLALWDSASDKLVQENHPNLRQILGDRDLDGTADEGFKKMFGFMDVVEVHPPVGIVQDRSDRNPIFRWLQLLNLGYRIPGVVNTDAHYNFHGSGWLRNYVKSPTDDPAQIKTLDVVHAAEKGQLILTNGPYLEVQLLADGKSADVGDEIELSRDEGLEVYVRVQCPNWFDVDRVQFFLNGRPEEALNFRRAQHPKLFVSRTVQLEHKFPIRIKDDTHVIVAAIGENSRLGPVMGPNHENDRPIAVSNPIFLDVDGDGFTPNGDLLDAELPFLTTGE